MSPSDDLCMVLDACRDHEWPRFPLQRRRLSLGGILAGGYEVTTTIRGIQFRFTAILCYGGTTYVLVWDTTKYNHKSYAAWAPMMDKTRSVHWL
jgi:hypothetical protein